MVQIILGGMILCGNPVVEQQLSAGVVGILLEHGLVALFDRGAHLALAHCPAHQLGIIGQIGGHTIDNLLVIFLIGTKTAGTKQEDALAVQGGEQRRDRRRACALVAPKTDEHHVGRTGALRLECNLICIRIVAQRRGVDKLDTRSLQSALDRARNHPGITALAVDHQRARHSHVASFPPKLKPLMQFIR